MLSIPKILRRFFLRDRRLLADLSRCGWQALKTLIQAAAPEAEPEPGAIVSTHSFGDFPERFHPHLHILSTDGVFYGKGLFRVASRFPVKELERLFRHKVLRLLLTKGKMNPEIIRIMDRWRHSGFNVYPEKSMSSRGMRFLRGISPGSRGNSSSETRYEL